MLKERAVRFGPGARLVGIETLPAEGRDDPSLPAVILLNAGVVHRVGPHRMTVYLARRLAESGFHVLRYDRSGLGDSQPRPCGKATGAAIADGQAAMDYLAATSGRRRFVFGGLCSGADNSIKVALVDKRVVGTILLDPFGYPTPRFYLERFQAKGADLGALVRYANRELRKVVDRWRPRPAEAASPSKPSSAYRRKQTPKEIFGDQLRRLTDRNVRILAVYTGSASDRFNYAEQFADGFRAFGLADRVDCIHLPQVNHTFTELAAQQLLCDHVGGWLERVFLPAQVRPATPEVSVQPAAAPTTVAASPPEPAAAAAPSPISQDDVRAAYQRLNATQVSYPREICLHTLFEAQVERSPDAMAVVAEGGALTYRELNRRANRLAHHLRQHGAAANQAIGICVDRSVEMVVGLLAILKSGSGYVPLDPTYPKDRLGYMLSEAKPRMILVQAHTAKLLPEAGAPLFDLENPACYPAADANPNAAVTATDLAYIIFTSGSTGKPKGAMNGHRGIVNRLLWMQDAYRLDASDRILQKTPFSFDVSVWEFFWPLITGAQLVMARPGGHKDSRYLVETIRAHAITTLHFVPSMLQAFLLDDAASTCTSLKRIICSGEALPAPVAEECLARLSAELHNLYGPTEAAVDVTYWQCLPKSGRASVPIGKPVANTQIYVLDEKMGLCPPGQPGELFIGGIQVGLGYVNRPDLTVERFVPDPFSDVPGARLYKTGDLARLTDEGVVEYLGRVDFQVKLRGFRIELGEIEARLLEHPQLRQAAVVLREDRVGDPRLVGYLVAKQAERIETSELKAWVAATLPEYMVPAAFVWMNELPLNANGKLDRKALPAPSRARRSDEPLAQPRNERETLLCRLFTEVLGLDAVGATENFFDLGGNSLLAMSLIARLRTEGIDLPVARFFQHPSPRAVDGYLSRRHDGSQRLPRPAARMPDVADGVAVIGMAGRFPGAPSIAELWRAIMEGRSTVTAFDDSTLDASLPAELVKDPRYVKVRGIIEGYDLFDGAFFGIGRREAELMDPQQRLLLECAWAALENAGYVPEAVDGLVGVYAGQFGNTYLTKNLLSNPKLESLLGEFGLLVENEKDYAATRIAHRLNLMGPAISIHTACSTSLVAVVEAFHALRAGRCDLALAGAASLTCPPRSGYVYLEGGMLSRDGQTRSFDADASGTTFNDGVAMVVLKRLADALRDGDTVLGVLRGAATNNDGGQKASFTAPSIEGQAAVISMAQQMAGVSPRSIGYVEAHGTATPIGDPIEVEALIEVFRRQTSDRGFCALGSVKSNIGHLVCASGATGLIKTLLALRNRVLPPTALFTKPNPKIDFEGSPFFVSATAREWAASNEPRRAGVSSFGVGGTNAHVVVEEFVAKATAPSPRPRQLLVWSARTATALDAGTVELARHLTANQDLNLADAAYTLALGRRALSERRFAVVSDVTDAAAALTDGHRTVSRRVGGREPAVCFLFPGQGSQYPGMGRGLYAEDPVFRAVVDECAERLKPDLGTDLRTLLYPEGESERAAEALRNTAFTQPALFTVEYAMAQVLLGWGIQPRTMLGHSVGEFVCAALTGVMGLEDALHLVAARGRMVQSVERGAMLSVRMPADAVRPLLKADLAIASDNGPSLCVVSGPTEPVAELERMLTGRGVACRPLQTSHAFHSPMMDPVVEPFAQLVRKVKLSAPKQAYISTVTAGLIDANDAQDPLYWARHLRQTVRFTESARLALADDSLVFVEVGPRNTLATLVKQQARDAASLVAVPTMGSEDERGTEWASVLRALGEIWAAGGRIDWASFYAGEARRRIPLPTYAFDRERCWIEPGAGAAPVAATRADRPNGSLSAADLIERQMELLRNQVQLVAQLRAQRDLGRR